MTTSSNGNESSRSDEDRRWKEEMDRLKRDLDEAAKEAERCLIKLEVLEELSGR
jgi:hypothetical protein